jgi:hypothetical protein
MGRIPNTIRDNMQNQDTQTKIEQDVSINETILREVQEMKKTITLQNKIIEDLQSKNKEEKKDDEDKEYT